jgi:hypothetical protein
MGGDARDVGCEGLTAYTSIIPTHATLVLSGLYRPQGPHYGLGWGSPILAITLSLSRVHCGDQLYWVFILLAQRGLNWLLTCSDSLFLMGGNGSHVDYEGQAAYTSTTPLILTSENHWCSKGSVHVRSRVPWTNQLHRSTIPAHPFSTTGIHWCLGG